MLQASGPFFVSINTHLSSGTHQMLIAQISDTHIVEEGRKTLGIAPTASNLERCIEHLNQFVPKPDIVLITGDITDDGTPQQYAHADKLLSALEIPYFIIPGNHDNTSNLWAQFSGERCPQMQEGSINYTIENFPVRLIGLDSTIPGAGGGELCEKRLSWLDQQLTKKPDQPTLIFMHHPPVPCSVQETDLDGFIGAEKLGNILDNYTNIERLICGHIHMPINTKWHGTIVSTAPSTGMRLRLDLTMQKEGGFFLDRPAYQIHHWTPQRNLVTHTIFVHDKKEPYPFEEDPNRFPRNE